MQESFRLVFLGTGAAVPSVRRSLPTLVIIFEQFSVLCDCSEGTQMRLAAAGISPARIRHIFISHLHGDHVFGLPGLLTTQQLLGRENPMTIWGPKGIKEYLGGIEKVTGHRIRFPLEIHEFTVAAVDEIKLDGLSFSAHLLDHSKPCYGYRISEPSRLGRFDREKAEKLGVPEGPQRKTLQEGNPITLENGITVFPDKVVGPSRAGRCVAYCTDTRPCSGTLGLAEGADVLLHDSTFDHSRLLLAKETTHSTSVEAAIVAKEAKVKTLFLWHISGRNDEANEKSMLASARAIFPATFLPEDASIWTPDKHKDD